MVAWVEAPADPELPAPVQTLEKQGKFTRNSSAWLYSAVHTMRQGVLDRGSVW